jgi:hypothetical protein
VEHLPELNNRCEFDGGLFSTDAVLQDFLGSGQPGRLVIGLWFMPGASFAEISDTTIIPFIGR